MAFFKKTLTALLSFIIFNPAFSFAGNCDVSLKNNIKNFDFYENSKNQSFLILRYADARYDDMAEVYDTSACKKISSGVESQSNYVSVFEKNNFQTVFKNKHPVTEYYEDINTWLTGTFSLTISPQSGKIAITTDGLPANTTDSLKNIINFTNGVEQIIVAKNLKHLESSPILSLNGFSSKLYKLDSKSLQGLSFSDFDARVSSLLDIQKELSDGVLKNVFFETISAKNLEGVVPTINSFSDFDSRISLLVNLDKSYGNTIFGKKIVSVLKPKMISQLSSVLSSTSSNSIDYPSLYASANLWHQKDNNFDIRSDVLKKYLDSDGYARFTDKINSNFSVVFDKKIASMDEFRITEKIPFILEVSEAESYYIVALNPSIGNGSMRMTISKECNSTNGAAYFRKEYEDNGNVNNLSYKKKTTVCKLSNGIASRNALEHYMAKATEINGFQVRTSYRGVNDFEPQYEEVYQGKTLLAVDQNRRYEYLAKESARKQCQQNQTMCYAQCESASTYADGDYKGFWRGYTSSPQSRCRERCSDMCN